MFRGLSDIIELLKEEGHIGDYKVIIPEIALTDNETIDKYELDIIRKCKYAELNERLYL